MLKWGRSRYIDPSLENIAYDNGMRLINFASSTNMVVGSTMCEHKDMEIP
jgi:hypothetical protein